MLLPLLATPPALRADDSESLILAVRAVAREATQSLLEIQTLAASSGSALDLAVPGEATLLTLDGARLSDLAEHASFVAIDCAYLPASDAPPSIPSDPLAAGIPCVELAKDPRYVEKDAIHTPSQPRIEWSRGRLSAYVAKLENASAQALYPLVFRELLSLAEIPDPNGEVSDAFWNVLQRIQTEDRFETDLAFRRETFRLELSEKRDPGIAERRLAISKIEKTAEYLACAGGHLSRRNRSCAAAYGMLAQAQEQATAHVTQEQRSVGLAEARLLVWAQSQKRADLRIRASVVHESLLRTFRQEAEKLLLLANSGLPPTPPAGRGRKLKDAVLNAFSLVKAKTDDAERLLEEMRTAEQSPPSPAPSPTLD